jgi:putative transcriptional regulator
LVHLARALRFERLTRKPFEPQLYTQADLRRIRRALRREAAAAELARKAESDTISSEDLRQVRSALGLSQAGLADLLGVSAHTLENWEGGRRKPPKMAKRLLLLVLRLMDRLGLEELRRLIRGSP